MTLIAQHILKSIQPSNDSTELWVQGNWPLDAVYGVCYKHHDKQFPNVNHGRNVEFFATLEKVEAWKAKTREWICGTDYDFSTDFTLYEWDLGPNVIESGQL